MNEKVNLSSTLTRAFWSEDLTSVRSLTSLTPFHFVQPHSSRYTPFIRLHFVHFVNFVRSLTSFGPLSDGEITGNVKYFLIWSGFTLLWILIFQAFPTTISSRNFEKMPKNSILRVYTRQNVYFSSKNTKNSAFYVIFFENSLKRPIFLIFCSKMYILTCIYT